MITITLTVADGGQGEVKEAVSVSQSISLTGMSAGEYRDLLSMRIAEDGIKVVQKLMGLELADVVDPMASTAQLRDAQAEPLRNLAGALLLKANRLDGRGL